MLHETRTIWIVGAIIVSAFVVLGAIGLTALIALIEIPVANREIAIGMLGGFAPLLGVVVKFWLDNAARLIQQTTVVQGSGSSQETTTS